MAVEFYIHKMSEHMETAQIVKWLVREGDRVDRFQVILQVETDKAIVDVESPEAGVIKGIRPGAVDGATVAVGEPICYIAEPDEAVPILPPLPGHSPEGARAPGAPASSQPSPPVALNHQHPSQPGEPGGPRDSQAIGAEVAGPRASPVARRVARELGVDLNQVQGTGPGGRISEADVRKHVETRRGVASIPAVPAMSSAPSIPPTPVDAVEWLNLTPVQKLTGERLRESVMNAPQFALDVAADMSQMLWLREQLADRVAAQAGAKPSVTALLVKVVAMALKRHPRANAEYSDGKLKVHADINIGVAVGTDEGLVVPVIKHADRKSLSDITRELVAFQEKAKTLRFSIEDLAGGTFTLSNLGMYGVDGFRAIVNPPQSAILAVGRIQKVPVGLADDTIALRPLMRLTLTADHRCLDGVQGSRFLGEIKDLLEQPHLLLAF